jgi:ATP-dependent Clp protease protease subunit
MLDSVKNSIINAYATKTGLSRNKLSKLMDDETWMDANMAVQLHFADEILKRPGLEKKKEDDPDEDGQDPEEKPDEGEEKPDEGEEKPDEDDPDKKKPSGMLFSTRRMAVTFTNKVKQHYAAEKKPQVEDTAEGRSIADCEERLRFLHSLM